MCHFDWPELMLGFLINILSFHNFSIPNFVGLLSLNVLRFQWTKLYEVKTFGFLTNYSFYISIVIKRPLVLITSRKSWFADVRNTCFEPWKKHRLNCHCNFRRAQVNFIFNFQSQISFQFSKFISYFGDFIFSMLVLLISTFILTLWFVWSFSY